MECLGLHNKPKAEVHPGHKLTGPKDKEEEGGGGEEEVRCNLFYFPQNGVDVILSFSLQTACFS
jgi:hypothetical protein